MTLFSTIGCLLRAGSAQYVPPDELDAGRQLPLFAHYTCPGAYRVVDVLEQNLADSPNPCCYPPSHMVGIVVQHLYECRTHAVIVFSGLIASWLPLLESCSAVDSS